MEQKFKIEAKHLFLTYPQCNLTKETVREELEKKLGNIQHVIAREQHEDGGFHLHCYVMLEKKRKITKPDFLDILGFHGNYQVAINPGSVKKYVMKDGDFITNIVETCASERSKGSIRSSIGKRVLEGEVLEDLLDEYPQLIFGYKSLKADIKMYRRDNESEKLPLPLWLPNPWGRVMPTRGRTLDPKKRHYWIFSREPNKGKTYHFAKPISRDYRASICTGDFQYWPIRDNDECIILDDYNTAKLKWDVLNQLCDGTYQFRVFMEGPKALDNPLIIVLSNQAIIDLYPHMNMTLYARFNIIELE